MKKKYIISGVLGTILLGLTTVSALNITKPTITDPVFKAVYIGGKSAGYTCSGNPSCFGTNSTICLDGCGGLYLNVNVAGNNTPRYSPYGYGYSFEGVWGYGYEGNNFGYSYGYNDEGVFGYGDGYWTTYSLENIVKRDPTSRNISVGKLLPDDIGSGIITSTHIFDRSILTRKLDKDSITIPSVGGMIESNNTCGSNETAIGISGGNMVCVPVSFLNTQSFLPNCGSGNGYSLFASGIQFVSGGQTIYGYKWTCKSNVVNVLGADGGDTNRSGSTTGDIRNKNTGNVGVGLTNPTEKLTVQDSLNVNGMGEKILCMRTDEYVDIDTYSEDDCAKCPAGFSYNTTTKVCEKGCAMCAGTGGFPNATLCTGDDAYVPAGSSYSLDLACDQPEGGKKCQYTCNPGFILINGTCKECMAGTFNTGSNACTIKPICDKDKQATLSGDVAVCAALGNCYNNSMEGRSRIPPVLGDFAPLGPKNYLISYYDYSDQSYKKKPNLSLIYIENPSRPIGENRTWKYVSKKDLEPNKCLYTCAEGAITYDNRCYAPECSLRFEDGTYANIWQYYTIANLSGATSPQINFGPNSWIDASDNADLAEKVGSQFGCFYYCPYGYDIDANGHHICKNYVSPPAPVPFCQTISDPSGRAVKREYFLDPIPLNKPMFYTGRDEFNIITGNKTEGCFYSCRPPAIKAPDISYCVPKCGSTSYYDERDGRCKGCNAYGTATGSPSGLNENNTKCVYHCPENLYLAYNRSRVSEYNCISCPAGKEPGGNKDSNGNYTNCVNKCDTETQGYSPTGDYCYSLNSTPTVCPSGFLKAETSPGVFQCIYCLSGTTWNDTEKKCK